MDSSWTVKLQSYRPVSRLWQRISPMLFLLTDLIDSCVVLSDWPDWQLCCSYWLTWLTVVLFLLTDLIDSCVVLIDWPDWQLCCSYWLTWLTVVLFLLTDLIDSCVVLIDWPDWQLRCSYWLTWLTVVLFLLTDLIDSCVVLFDWPDWQLCCSYWLTWLTVVAEDFSHVVCIYRPDWRLWQRISPMLFIENTLERTHCNTCNVVDSYFVTHIQYMYCHQMSFPRSFS